MGGLGYRLRAMHTPTDRIRARLSTNPLLKLVGFEWVESNERVVVEVTAGARAAWVARGGSFETSIVRTHRLEGVPDIVGFHIYDKGARTQDEEATIDKLLRAGVDSLAGELINRVGVCCATAHGLPASAPLDLRLLARTRITLAVAGWGPNFNTKIWRTANRLDETLASHDEEDELHLIARTEAICLAVALD